MDASRIPNQAFSIRLLSFDTPQMRAFHLSWLAFFAAFIGWFGVAPLMAIIRDDLDLSQAQIGNTIIASVAATIVARVGIGWLTDRIGPRKAYAGLLSVAAVPVLCIGLSQNYETFLLLRLAIGIGGASFVITQYHTSLMFAANVVGTANATTAGWGNAGGGAAQIVMPLLFAAMLTLGVSETVGWRLAMLVPGVAILIIALLYYRLTQDTPAGNFKDLLAARPDLAESHGDGRGAMLTAVRDVRVWALFLMYAGSFGIELTINNVAALYYHDRFDLNLQVAGLIAGMFGLTNLFARTSGGMLGDQLGIRWGLRGRAICLGLVLLCEGLALILFSRMTVLGLAIPAMIVFAIFVQMSEGATFAVVPLINRKALGAVSGIVGAGGNVGAVAAGFLFRSEGLDMADAFLILGIIVACLSVLAILGPFSSSTETEEERAFREQIEAARQAG